MTDLNNTTSIVNLFAVGIFDNVESIATALASGKVEVIAPTETIDGADAVAQWGQLDKSLDSMATDFSKVVRNAGLILYVTRCLEEGDSKVTREAIAVAVTSRGEFLAANPDPADPTKLATHSFTRGFALAMLTQYGTKTQRKANGDNAALTLLGAASRWGKAETSTTTLKAACEKAATHAAKASAGRATSGADKGRPKDESELGAQLGRVTAENAQHVAANKGLLKQVKRVETSAAMHLQTMRDVLATLENASLDDKLARNKAATDLRGVVGQHKE